MHNPFQTILIGILFLGFHVFSAAQFPLSGEEAYYWTWSTEWDLGYWHHPPMIAYSLGIATSVLPKTELSVRVTGIILHILSSFLVAQQTKKPNQTILLFLTLPGLVQLGMEATPQIYFYSFFTFALWAWTSERWFLFGLFCCFCFLTTMAAILLLPIFLLSWFFVPNHRKKITIAVFGGLLGAVPWLHWFLTHDEYPLGLFYNLQSQSRITSFLDLIVLLGCIIFAPSLWPKQKPHKIIWICTLVPILAVPFVSAKFIGLGWGAAGVLYMSYRFPDRVLSLVLGVHLFAFGVGKINLHFPLLPSSIHAAQTYNGGEIIAGVIHAWGISDVWTSSPFDAAWIRFYSDKIAHTNSEIGSKSQFDLWPKPFPNSGIIVQEYSQIFSIPEYTFSSIQTTSSYTEGFQEGSFVETHRWNTALFHRSSSDKVEPTPNNVAD